MNKKLISFILPIYNEQLGIPRLWQELQDLQSKIVDYNCQFIFVNDGSRDDSIAELTKVFESSNNVKVINFARNFGHQIAVTAGQDLANEDDSDAVIIMDSDLQDPPLTCLDLIAKWEEGFDIVYAQRSEYKAGFLKKTLAFWFYRILKKIASVDVPVDTGDFRLISGRVNSEMSRYKEKARYLRGISSLVGFNQVCVQFKRSERFAGKTGYTFFKSLRLAFDGITGFSIFPLQIISLIGFFVATFGFVFGFVYVLFSALKGHIIEGWTSLMSVFIFFSGVQMLMLGIIGEYLGRIYIEALDRPLYTIDRIWDKDKS
jgi:polyisoprenyl-phosphate glycosyltransferase